ncbi:hypothetical protein PFAG_05151 [Plasmodium falciparum Santa Lucia]|uniref:Uncharacterized protein n=6 Tax=Plasmodium falciparum TaxID=5833 RepID=W7JMN3_PLAFO|nr:hypothetical protein PFFVO_04706 [Plasmodium falciparum Vietnam Oak-Knoll (FVO)]ETW46948.1 hypothetical protein PFMALIP_04938 [Plasmodium falciparum MaliPS096_E11]ETW59063.1 hypothetical protein PFMC_05053 [Plasmodium falciparum CAMP/Malaysia]EUR64879.1 hypothetical protein PFBG_05117 [Plasmodium falciparum 7G8]EUT78575.1 hypothetical protein PFAG_05151 [Plasmodium falciparum Santa Lucia]EWC86188.1 hypothetical protein PFNF54_04919 [Plasmodium falciparum NF54]
MILLFQIIDRTLVGINNNFDRNRYYALNRIIYFKYMIIKSVEKLYLKIYYGIKNNNNNIIYI